MNGDLHHIDDLFKSGIEGKEENPSPAVWANIEKELDKKDSRPRFFYFWNARKISAAVLIFLGSAGLFAGGYYLGVKKENNKEAHRQNVNSSEVIKQGASGQQPEMDGAINSDSKTRDQNSNQRSANSPAARAEQPDRSNQSGNQASQGETARLAGPERSVSDRVQSRSSSDKKGADQLEAPANTDKAGNSVPGQTTETTRGKNPYDASSLKKNNQGLTSKDRPVAASDKANTSVAVTDEINQNLTVPGKWELQSVAANSSARTISIAENNSLLKTAPELNQSAATKNIPVLNKRSSSVDLPKFSITPVASFQFGSNKIVATQEPHAHNVKNDIDRSESVSSSISGGVLADLRIAKNMTLQSGLVFTSRTIEIEPKFIKAERNPDGKVRYKLECSAGTYYIKKSTYARPGDSAMTVFSTNDLNYINIPLALTYHFGGKKFSFFATAGAGLNLLTDQYLETGLKNYNYDEHESIATNLKSRYFNGTIGAGISYRPFKKISFQFSPQYQFAVSPMNENMPVKAYPRIFNLQAGMQIRL